MTNSFQITHLDHLVLTVVDVELTCEFYTRVTGFDVVTYRVDRKALAFENKKINLHEIENKFDLTAALPMAGRADLYFFSGNADRRYHRTFSKLWGKFVAGPNTSNWCDRSHTFYLFP